MKKKSNRISKEKAIKFAIYEFTERNGESDEPIDLDNPSWTIKDEVIQDESYKSYMTFNDAASTVATMMYDGIFQNYTKEGIKYLKRLYGAKLWEEAIYKYIVRDHDT